VDSGGYTEGGVRRCRAGVHTGQGLEKRAAVDSGGHTECGNRTSGCV
jgi:hypothetical protein